MELWAHQKEGVKRALSQRDFGLFFEPGCGKTRTTIEILRHQYAANKTILPTLIVAPIVVVPNWRDEFLKYSKITADRIICLTGTGVKRAAAIKNAQANQILITNYEALQMKEVFEALKAWHPKIIVWDEAHRLKNPQAIRTKKAIELADIASHRYTLTGTPVLNTFLDIFSQFRVLDCGETFGRNFFAFRAQYFWDKNAGMPKHNYFPNWIPRSDTEMVLQKFIQRKSMHVEKSQCLDLPPLVRQEIDVELSTEQRRLYEEMKKHFVTYVEDKACVASLAITKALRMQQIISGFVKFDGVENEKVFDDVPRTKVLSELLEDIAPNHKVIVWAVFSPNYNQISKVCRALGFDYAFLTGETKNKEEEIKKFREQKSVRVLIAHPGAGGIGVNLVEASYSINFTRDWSLEHDIQSRARNFRGGSEMHEKITQIDLVTRGTIDELILQALSRKQNLANSILDIKSLL